MRSAARMFLRYYPAWELTIGQVVNLVFSPSGDRELVREVIVSFGGWLERAYQAAPKT